MYKKKKKVIPRIFGGIGNQLFCYAAARRMAIVNDAELAIDYESGFKYDYLYKRKYQLDHFTIPCRKINKSESFKPFSRIQRSIIRYINSYIIFEDRRYIRQEIKGFDERLLNIRLNGIIYLEGYWQSEKYFKDIEQIIRTDLNVIPPTDEINIEISRKILNNNSIALHVRFFDSPDQGGLHNATEKYYTEAIKKIENEVNNPHYYLFSDQPERAREKIKISDDQITVIKHNKGDHNAYADLWLMTLCKHYIIANSTFSWWGAWLSKNKNKIVICPGKINGIITSWGFDGLIPDEWYVIEINQIFQAV